MLRRASAIASLLILGLSVTPASAGPIMTIVSGDGETWVGGAAIGGGSGVTVVVTPHPAWQPSGAASWVSYGSTGYGGALLAPPSGTNSVMTVFETFTAGAGSVLNMKIWADDTARVRVNGMELLAPNFTQDTCAGGSIGCQPHEFGSIVNYVFQTGGLQTIAFETFQVGTGTNTTSNPFGLLYEGTVETTAVPEPATLALLGLGAAVVAIRRRRTPESR